VDIRSPKYSYCMLATKMIGLVMNDDIIFLLAEPHGVLVTDEPERC
jgi:hypothetical protein